MAKRRIADLAVCVASGVCRLCFMLAVAGAALVHHANAGGEAVSDDDKARKEILDLMFQQPEPSFDTAPVRFYINGTLFAVPRNMIAHMPAHVLKGSSDHSASKQSDSVTLHLMLPDMAGLTEANADCYLLGSGCEQLVRVYISAGHTASALVPRKNEAKYYGHWGGTPTEITDDLAVFPLREGTRAGFRVYLGRLSPDVSLPFQCNVPDYIAPLCRIMTGLEPERGTVTILFNKHRWGDWRSIYEGVFRLIATFRVEN